MKRYTPSITNSFGRKLRLSIIKGRKVSPGLQKSKKTIFHYVTLIHLALGKRMVGRCPY